jgi:hypothetical protein
LPFQIEIEKTVDRMISNVLPDLLSCRNRPLQSADDYCVEILKNMRAYRALVGKPEGRRPLGRPRRRWEDNIKIDLPEVGRGGVDWIDLAQDRDRWRVLVCTVMNLRVP